MNEPPREAVVREARVEDVDAILPLFEWLFAAPGAPPPGWDPAAAAPRLREAIAAEYSTVLLAEKDDELAGFCTAYLELNSIRYGQRCWVEDLAVHPGRRSRGIGEGLLTRARDWARDRGATHLELDTGRARVDAQRFYERQAPAWSGITYAWWLAEPPG